MADKTVVVRIVVRANQFSSGLRGAAADVNKFAVDVERGSAKAGSSALALGAASATAGKLMLVGIGGALAVSAKAAIDYESSLAGVAKTTDLAGSAFAKAGSPLAAFGEALRGLSMRIPVNVNDLASIAEMGGQLGIEVPNLIEFTEVMAALGVTTNLAGNEAATGLARFVNIMGTGQDQFNRLGSVIVELGNNLATTESEILHFGLRLAPTGAAVGMTEEAVLALSGALTSLGIPAERGGTALQRLFLNMQSAVLGGGESLGKWANATRMTREEFSALFRENPELVFLELAKQLDATASSGGNAAGILSDLGIIEQRSIQVLLAASNGWEVVAESIDLANIAGEEGTALQEEAAKRYGTTASQIQMLSNSFNDLRIEVGNALLGSGGLAAGIDFVREFFRIIKDNLPMLGNLVKVLVTIAALRIGANIFSGFQAGLVHVRAMKVGLDGVTASTKALRLAQLGLNVGVFAAIALVGALATAWGAAAVKAAELKGIVGDLRGEIEGGADPMLAWIEALEKQGIFTDENKRLLEGLGLSQEEFIRRIFKGNEAFRDLGAAARSGQGDIDAWAKILGTGREEVLALNDTFEETKGQMNTFGDLVNESTEILDAFFKDKSDEVTNGLIEAGLNARFSTDEIRTMADEAVRFFGMKVPVDNILAAFGPTGTIGMPRILPDLKKQAEETVFTWEEMVLGMEGGADRIDDFWDALVDTTDKFNGDLADSFKEIRDTIMDGFPDWDEYEQVTQKGFGKVLKGVLKAQELFLEDLRDGIELSSAIAGEVSAGTLAFIEGLDPATKGALARFRRTNEDGFSDWLGDVEANLNEADDLTQDFWLLKLPENLQMGFAGLLAVMSQNVGGFGLPGEQAAGMFVSGVEDVLSRMPEEHQDEFLGYVADALSNPEFLLGLGIAAGDPVVEGMLRSLRTMAERAKPIINAQAVKMQKDMKDAWGVYSPSRVTQEIGLNITRGLFGGMEDEYERQLSASQSPIVNLMGSKPIVNLKTTVQGGSRDIVLNYPQHKSDDIIDGVKKAAVLSGLQRDAEVAIGPG